MKGRLRELIYKNLWYFWKFKYCLHTFCNSYKRNIKSFYESYIRDNF